MGAQWDWRNEEFLFSSAWFLKDAQFFVPSMLCVFIMHAFHFHLGKKVRFLSNIAAFVMSPYPNASINPVSPLCGISVVGLSLHMTLRTDRWKVS